MTLGQDQGSLPLLLAAAAQVEQDQAQESSGTALQASRCSSQPASAPASPLEPPIAPEGTGQGEDRRVRRRQTNKHAPSAAARPSLLGVLEG